MIKKIGRVFDNIILVGLLIMIVSILGRFWWYSNMTAEGRDFWKLAWETIGLDGKLTVTILGFGVMAAISWAIASKDIKKMKRVCRRCETNNEGERYER